MLGRPQPVTFTPIGVARTPFLDRLSAPRQPYAARGVLGTIELFPGRDFEHALEDLDGWDHLWVIFWFHLNHGWRPKVLPPRSHGKRRGVFSTRSPHRPNPIGLSVVKLVEVRGLSLRVSDIDLIDGTPILDLKPYVPYADALPEARTGWLSPRDPEPGFVVVWSELGAAQAAWLREVHAVELDRPVNAILELGPEPHPYRRIKRDGEGFLLAVKDWRVRFRVEERRVVVESIESGYRAKELALSEAPAVMIQRAFVERWNRPPPGS